MSRLWAWLVGALALIAAFFIALRTANESGKQEQKADDAESSAEQVAEANRIRDRLNSDTEYAKRVRDRFSR